MIYLLFAYNSKQKWFCFELLENLKHYVPKKLKISSDENSNTEKSRILTNGRRKKSILSCVRRKNLQFRQRIWEKTQIWLKNRWKNANFVKRSWKNANFEKDRGKKYEFSQRITFFATLNFIKRSRKNANLNKGSRKKGKYHQRIAEKREFHQRAVEKCKFQQKIVR